MKALPKQDQRVIQLCIYHGCRSGEVVQLEKDDLQTAHGVTFMRLCDDEGGRGIKNIHSVRDVPPRRYATGRQTLFPRRLPSQRVQKSRVGSLSPLKAGNPHELVVSMEFFIAVLKAKGNQLPLASIGYKGEGWHAAADMADIEDIGSFPKKLCQNGLAYGKDSIVGMGVSGVARI